MDPWAIVDDFAVDLFGGPGGWEVHAEALGLRTIGVEWDTDACATRRAAGLFTVQADVAALEPRRFAAVFGRPEGLIGSPPCPLFSSAGRGAGRLKMATDHLRRGVEAAARGESDIQLARRRRQLARDYLGYVRAASPKLRRGQMRREANRLAYEAALVWQPARWAARLRPRWIALEQVPPVLPLWKALAHVLEGQGYRCWVGVLSAERYGVPQTRKRAFLIASRDGAPVPPEPTHQAYVPGEPARAQEPDLFGPGLLPWVSMAEALGWGLNARPATTVPSVSEGGPRHDGGSGARELVRKAVEAGEWEGPLPPHVQSSVDRVRFRPNDGLANVTERDADEPAPTVAFGHNPPRWVVDTVAVGGSGGRVFAPGHKRNAEDEQAGRDYAGRPDGAVRVSVEEAAVLQSFPADWPWQGTRTSQFQQVGNAVPPGQARPVLEQARTPTLARRTP